MDAMAAPGGEMAEMANDPFLTHAARATRPPEQTVGAQEMEDRAAARNARLAAAAAAAKSGVERGARAVVYYFTPKRAALIACSLFLWVLLLKLVIGVKHPVTCRLLTFATVVFVSLALLFELKAEYEEVVEEERAMRRAAAKEEPQTVGDPTPESRTSQQPVSVPLSFVIRIFSIRGSHGVGTTGVSGRLLFLNFVIASLVGGLIFDAYARQYWWLQSGEGYFDTYASSPAAARADAAWVRFSRHRARNATSDELTLGETGAMVDPWRAAGYRDGRTYCVAPIMDAVSAAAEFPRVEYWAVGVDCCQPRGNFICDASRDFLPDGGYGVVLLSGAAGYEAAVQKAAAAHNLVSAPGALFVRYVRDPNDVGFWLLFFTILLALASVLGDLLFSNFMQTLMREARVPTQKDGGLTAGLLGSAEATSAADVGASSPTPAAAPPRMCIVQ